MYSKTSIIVLLFFIATNSFGQKEITISGFVSDNGDGEKLISAVISDSVSNIHTITNHYGFYSITLPAGWQNLKFSYVGYQASHYRFELYKDSFLNVALEPGSYIQEVRVTAEDQNRFVSGFSPGVKHVSLKSVRLLPVILGEKDILKSIQLLPGIHPGSEANTGFYVRGGEADNNLILLDGVEVFNPNHLFGFFSFFNDDAIKSVKVFTSGFPAQYNGKVASVIDIRTKDGDATHVKMKGSVGLISSKLQLEGPIIKEKLSFIFSGRRTYLDIFPGKMVKKFTDYSDAGYYFYDLNGRICWKLNPKNNLYLSYYSGKDEGYFQSENREGEYPPDSLGIFTRSARKKNVSWGSQMLTLRYEKILSPTLFMNLAAGYSHYHYSGKETREDVSMFWIGDSLYSNPSLFPFSTSSDIQMLSIGIDFDHNLNRFGHFTYGLGTRFYGLKPNLDNAFISSVSDNNHFICKTLNVFFQDELKITSKLSIRPGLNLTYYQIDEENHLKLEKRFLVNYFLNSKISLNASYSDMTQYLHLLQLGRISLASDLWLPSMGTIRPTDGRDLSVGIYAMLSPQLSFNLSVFKREYKNLLSYKEGLVLNDTYRSFNEMVTTGNGNAKGIEISIEKSTGSLTGLLSYCLSLSERKFNELNQGLPFRAQYDRPHVVKIIAMKEFRQNFSVSGSFHLMSGALQTVGFAKYNTVFQYGLNPWSDYGGGSWVGNKIIVYHTHSYRMPLYHRLDVSISYSIPKTIGKHVFNLGFYNLYNARNTYEIQTLIVGTPDQLSSRLLLKKKSLFPIIPFINYCFEIK